MGCGLWRGGSFCFLCAGAGDWRGFRVEACVRDAGAGAARRWVGGRGEDRSLHGAARRSETERGKRPGRCGRDDGFWCREELKS